MQCSVGAIIYAIDSLFAMHVRRSAFEIDQGIHDDSFTPCGHVTSLPVESVYPLHPCHYLSI
jgi:hypothetical protein